MNVGSRVGPYEVIAKLGEGGMGEVYRARDTKLGREVAIKILPEAFASDPERLARFEREARTLASLNHPHIAQIHGFEDSGATRALVMELVEGEDLAQRLARGPIPLDEAIPIATQIADALEAAHEQGIIHRDLKPANIKLRADGTVKVLDFGLAKALEGAGGAGGAGGEGLLNSPTITSPAMTMRGMILGTAAYMAPEQAKGKAVDKRADIWAFGCVLYEMLSGRSTFAGETVTDVIAAVVTREPDFAALPPTTPGPVRRLLSRCLQKDPRHRLRDIGDARADLSAMPDVQQTAATSSPSRWLPVVAATVAGVLIGAAAIWQARPTPVTTSSPLRQLDIYPQGEDVAFTFARPMLSPSGEHIVMPAGVGWSTTNRGLTVRRLSETTETALAGTEYADPLVGWSPDGREIAWVARRRLWRMATDGGRATPIANVPASLGGNAGIAWLTDGRMLLAGSPDALLLEASASGGPLRTFMPIDAKRYRDLHAVAVLPDERALVVVAHPEGQIPNRLDFVDLAARTIAPIIDFPGEQIGYPAWSPTGHILFERSAPERAVWALPFDPVSGRSRGDPFMLVPGAGMPSVSHDGMLAFVRGGREAWRQLTWVDAEGRMVGTIGRPAAMLDGVAVDRAGARVLAMQQPGTNLQSGVWLWDTRRGTNVLVSDSPNVESMPAWTADERGYLWSVVDRGLVLLRASPGVDDQEIYSAADGAAYVSPAPDGKTFVLSIPSTNGSRDILMGSLGGKDWPALIGSPADEDMPRISPDGALIAYVSNETGQFEIFVDAFPSLGAKLQVSAGGGLTPRWGPNRTLYYISNGRMMSAVVSGLPPSLPSPPRTLFSLAESGVVNSIDGFDVDGSGRFLMLRSMPRPQGPPIITVVLGTLPALAAK